MTFTGIDDDGPSTVVYVFENGLSLFAGNINGYGDTATLSTTLILANGALVDFAVGVGSHYDFDSTGIDATLTLGSGSVPETRSISLLGLGTFSLHGMDATYCVQV